jgi:hypothetical protein
MNEKKLQLLLAAARNDTAPAPPADFAAGVLRALRRDPPAPTAPPLTVGACLNRWFPRLAPAAAAVIILCLAADWGLTAAGLPGITDGAGQLSVQPWFDAEDL